MSDSPNRSFERIEIDDLRRLVEKAQGDLDSLFKRKPPASGVYEGRCVLLCLCQGAALHFVRGERGVQDFDVLGLFPAASIDAISSSASGQG